jgi:hypothetical protein
MENTHCIDVIMEDIMKYIKILKKDELTNKSTEQIITYAKGLYRNKIESGDEIDLLSWMRVNEPSDNMIYKKEYWKSNVFFRDTIPFLLLQDYEEYKKFSTMVISTHTSKSILLPVVKMFISKHNMTVIVRHDFHDFKISIKSEKELIFDTMNLFKQDRKINSIDCEGFKEEWVYDSYTNNKKQFTIKINDGYYEAYTFFYILKNYLSKI